MAKDKTTAPVATTAPVETTAPKGTTAKGRPTPKRAQQEASKIRPLVLDPKASSKQRKERDREQRIKEDYALRTGDERNMPLMHRGADRRYIRDFVDARTSVGELLIPASLVLMVVAIVLGTNQLVSTIMVAVVYVYVFVSVGDAWFALRSLRKRLEAKFGASKVQRGWRLYATSRMLNVRRFRAPRPKVKRGEYPV